MLEKKDDITKVLLSQHNYSIIVIIVTNVMCCQCLKIFKSRIRFHRCVVFNPELCLHITSLACDSTLMSGMHLFCVCL